MSIIITAYNRVELMYFGLCLKQKNTWIDKRVYRFIKNSVIVYLPPTHRSCRGRAEHAINITMSRHDGRDKPRGEGQNPSNVIHGRCQPHHDENIDILLILDL